MSATEYYKQQKEAFVSNTVGGPPWRIHSVCLVALTSYLLYAALYVKQGPMSLTLQYIIFVLPLLAALTVLEGHPLLLNGVLLILFGVVTWIAPKTRESVLFETDDKVDLVALRRKTSITTYRAHLLLMTVICILAVDFRVFPREFAKTETWGTSVMDLGVGSFVFALGIVTAFSISKRRIELARTPLLVQLKTSLFKASQVLLLGVVRFVSVKGVDYPEHLSEYGRHWNFFFTIGILPVFSTLALALFGTHTLFTLSGLGLSVFYQALYRFTPLQDWVLNASRVSLISDNKEGLASLPGYISIFFIAIGFGFDLLVRRESSHATRTYDTNRLPLRLAARSLLFWVFLGAYDTFGGDAPSRRLCNLPYVLWTVAFNTAFLFGYYAVYEYAFASGILLESSLLDFINGEALAVFLVANVLTGLVNISLPTLYLHDAFAFLVLIVYSIAVLISVALIMRWKRKFL